MRKYIIAVAVLICITAIILAGVTFFGVCDTDAYETCVAIYKYGNSDKYELLSAKESSALKDIFDGKIMYSDSPSCGFSNDISVVFDNDKIFSVARDGCTVIYFKNKNKYIKLSEHEYEKLMDILSTHGFVLPCI